MSTPLQLVSSNALEEDSRVQSEVVASAAADFLEITPMHLGPEAATTLRNLRNRLRSFLTDQETVLNHRPNPKHAAYDAFFHVERVEGNAADVLASSTIVTAYELAEEMQTSSSLIAIERNNLFAALQMLVASLLPSE